MIVIFVGKSGSAKSTLMNHLIEFHNFSLPDWYTTRAPRNDPSDNAYIFVGHEEFLYQSKLGIIQNASVVYDNLYGTTFPDSDNVSYASVMDVEGLWRLKRKLGDKVVGILVEASAKTRALRMLERGDNPENIKDRLVNDEDKFKDAFHVADYKISSSSKKNDILELIDILKDARK